MSTWQRVAQGTATPSADPLAAWSAARRRRNRIIVSAVVGGIAAASVIVNVAALAGGDLSAGGRVVVGLMGVAAAGLLWARPWLGARLALAWAAVQIPFVDWTGDGGLTEQVLSLPLTFSSSSRVIENGAVTAENYFAFGINLVGIILAIWLANRRPVVERPDWD